MNIYYEIELTYISLVLPGHPLKLSNSRYLLLMTLFDTLFPVFESILETLGLQVREVM